MPAIRVPPGRSGRLWLRHRLEIAEHAADLLDQKLRILRGDERTLEERAEASEVAWREASQRAGTWLLRAQLAGGQEALRPAIGVRAPEIGLRWTSVVGVRVPEEPTVAFLDRTVPIGGAAVIGAAAAHREAVEAAVRYAATSRAASEIRAEIGRVTRRTRALRRHWIPRLEEALARAVLELEEQERGESVRRRWAATRA